MSLQEEAENFYRSVGVAITDWAHIDNEFFELCAEILGSNLRQTAIIYYRTPSIDARITLLDDLIETVLPKSNHQNGARVTDLEREWRKLVKDLKTELQIRNQLAHAPAMPFLKSADETNDSVELSYWYASRRSKGERLRGRANDERLLTVDDLRKHIKIVSHLFIRIRNVRTEICQIIENNIREFGSSATG